MVLADACFKTALSILPELVTREDATQNVETFLLAYVKNVLSVLLVVPDSPDRGTLSLIRSLLSALQTLPWEPHGDLLVQLYLSVLDTLSAMAQDSFPYHVDKGSDDGPCSRRNPYVSPFAVESNDTLYGSDPKFIAEIDKMCGLVVKEVLYELKQLGPGRKQSLLALEFFVRVSLRADLTDNALKTLAFNLFQLGAKQAGAVDPKYTVRKNPFFKFKVG